MSGQDTFEMVLRNYFPQYEALKVEQRKENKKKQTAESSAQSNDCISK